MASRSGPGQAKSMTLWRSFSNGMILRKMMSRNASLTAESCPLTHFAIHQCGSLTKCCLDLRLRPLSAKCWSPGDHESRPMKLLKWTTMWTSSWPSTPFVSIHSIHATHCNTNDYDLWRLHFAAALFMPSPSAHWLLNNIPQLVKPHQSQGWQESSMESRYLSHSNADDLDNLGVSLSNVE